jgi:glycosyltransferase involved in cell wall biosynthesis
MVYPMKICVNTQTPLMKFKAPKEELGQLNKAPTMTLNMNSLEEGADFEFTPGGVTRMVLPLLTHMMKMGVASDAHWVCLNPEAPASVRLDGITIHHVALKRERRVGYGLTKEVIWRVFHGLTQSRQTELLWADDFVDYTYYNRVSAELIRTLDSQEDFDLFYIHDFQQLPVGHMLQTLKPKVLRWHIPFDESMIPSDWSGFLSTYFNSYDAVVVSCRKYLDALRSFGYAGESFYVYPYVDQSVYDSPTRDDLAELKTRLNLRGNEKTILLVARLDPMKGHDTAMRAMPQVLAEVPNVKFVMIGNGSFSSSKHGLGLSKSDKWLMELKNLAKSLRVEDNVVFAGYLPQRLLNAAYENCDMTILPSRKEGFGLVVVESWLYRKPTVVSSKAGIAELVDDGRNGLLVNPGDPAALADKISTVLTDARLADKIGENGYLTSRKCLIEEGVRAEGEIMRKLI